MEITRACSRTLHSHPGLALSPRETCWSLLRMQLSSCSLCLLLCHITFFCSLLCYSFLQSKSLHAETDICAWLDRSRFCARGALVWPGADPEGVHVLRPAQRSWQRLTFVSSVPIPSTFSPSTSSAHRCRLQFRSARFSREPPRASLERCRAATLIGCAQESRPETPAPWI